MENIYVFGFVVVAILLLIAWLIYYRKDGRRVERHDRYGRRGRYGFTDPTPGLRAEIGNWLHDIRGQYKPMSGEVKCHDSHKFADGCTPYDASTRDFEGNAIRDGLYTRGAAASGPSYDQMLTSSVVSDRMEENHAKWVADMRPFSGSNLLVRDTVDAGAHVAWVGLRRPKAVPVSPYAEQVADHLHDTDIAHHKDFRFNGSTSFKDL